MIAPRILPTPFFEPDHWKRAEAVSSGVPLELYVSVGGRLKAWLRQAVLAGSPWTTSLFGKGARRRTVLGSAVREAWRELKDEAGVSAVVLEAYTSAEGEQEAREFFGPSAEVARALDVVSAPGAEGEPLGAWLKLVFPSCAHAHAMGAEDSLAHLLTQYRKELPLVECFPWEELSYWPSFLRAYGKAPPAKLEAASLDWARFQAFVSPHDELGEAESLGPGELMLSPSLQIVPCASRGEMHFVARDPRSGLIVDHLATWQEAALVDHLSEEFRLAKAELLEAVSRETAPAALNGLGKAAAASDTSLAQALGTLCRHGLVLGG